MRPQGDIDPAGAHPTVGGGCGSVAETNTCAVANHSYAVIEAKGRGLGADFAAEESPLST